MPNKHESKASRSAVQRRSRRTAARKQAKSRRGQSTAAIAIGLGLSASSARAATFEVSTLADSGAGSLRAALDMANLAPGADTITFQSGLTGTITLTTGQLEIEDSVVVEGPGADALAVSGNDASRVFYISQYGSDVEVTISGLKVTHGSTTTNGGGIKSGSAKLTLDAVEITGNLAAPQTTGQGGGVWVRAAMGVTIIDSVISMNAARQGGGIYTENLDEPLEIQSSHITGNDAQEGAGLFVEDAQDGLTIEKGTVSGNHAMSQGGGIFVRRTGSGGTVTLKASTLSGNTADRGGALALYLPDGPIAIESATLSGNQATNGGAIYCAYCEDSFAIRHSTIAGNTASGNGAILVQEGLVTLSHVIIADNTAAADQLLGTFTADHSLIETPGSSSITDGGGNILNQDPKLGALAENGGPTRTQLPAAGSPAIDAGDMSIASAPTFDQRNNARIVGARIDIGAVERNSGTLQCSLAEHSVAEGAGSVSVMVTRTGGSDGDVSVAYATGNGSASAPDDYTTASGTLQWPQGDTAAKSVQIPIVSDERAESNETFVLHLSDPAGTSLGSTTSAAVTITDDDAAPTISAIGDLTVSEGATSAPIAITVGDADDAPANLMLSATSSNHTVLDDAGAKLGGSGMNRTLTITALSAGAGESTVSVTVSDGTNVATRSFKVTVVAAPAQEQDAGAPPPQDSGTETSFDAGTSDVDAAMGPKDAAVETPDSGSSAEPDASPDAGSEAGSSSDSGCGCEIPGHTGSAPKSLYAGVVALAAAVWRRRRSPLR